MKALRDLAKLFCVAWFVLWHGLYPADNTWQKLQDTVTEVDRYFAWLGD
jgi:hypothetical protein